ncbi:DUF3900 domain-containing protein [Virgibacillus salexigens]|uniref:DUF3898 domain-containing protein n=2 Tax=Virgibacillus TaxID=84406 RepID=A0A024QF65_9BACI|nr:MULTISPECIES: DUF3900 domain-containing protein [Virgibacillus]GGJ68292.1 hypothetical protein GCM10007111_32540 [Virgibacillus kapii]CDQ41134.1 hypothetical protein BN990_03489 [Virgibacillus massiliensis]
MDFTINYLSFYLIQVDGEDKRAQHFQTLDKPNYEASPLKEFLDGELTRIAKRKVERHAKSENAPTKIGRFMVEPGHELTSNPNYNVFQKVRNAETTEDFQSSTDQLAQMYVDTSAVRGGVFLVAAARLTKYFDDPFLFVMKCDFEPKVARITNQETLVQNVEMAITTKNMKSIQYPYMPEEGIMDEAEIKIHQSSHARYFEDFLPFVSYEKSMPEIMKTQVMDMVQDHINETFPEESEEKEQFEEAMEEWAVTPEREIQERLTTEQVVEASAQIVEHTPDAELKMKLDHIAIKAHLSDFGECLHLAKVNGKYILMVEAEQISFDKGFSPIEFHKPDDLESVVKRILDRG